MAFQSLLILVATPLWIFLLQAIVFRIPTFRRLPRQKIAALSCVAGVIFVCCCARFTPGSFNLGLANWIFVGLSALGLSHVYFHLFNMSETARRIRILTELKQNGHLNTSGDPSHWTAEMLGVRLERLVSLKQVSRQGDKFVARPALLGLVAAGFKSYERWLFP